MPPAWRAAAARNDVVVLPFVPVTPTVSSSRLGSPYHHAAAEARAAAPRSTTRTRDRDVADRSLDRDRRRATMDRLVDEVVAVDAESLDGDEQVPRRDQARVVLHAGERDAAAAGRVVRGRSAPTSRPSREPAVDEVGERQRAPLRVRHRTRARRAAPGSRRGAGAAQRGTGCGPARPSGTRAAPTVDSGRSQAPTYATSRPPKPALKWSMPVPIRPHMSYDVAPCSFDVRIASHLSR